MCFRCKYISLSDWIYFLPHSGLSALLRVTVILAGFGLSAASPTTRTEVKWQKGSCLKSEFFFPGATSRRLTLIRVAICFFLLWRVLFTKSRKGKKSLGSQWKQLKLTARKRWSSPSPLSFSALLKSCCVSIATHPSENSLGEVSHRLLNKKLAYLEPEKFWVEIIQVLHRRIISSATWLSYGCQTRTTPKYCPMDNPD